MPISRSSRRSIIRASSTALPSRFKRIDSETVENDGVGVLRGAHGILVAPGFGARGVKGKLRAIQHARENKIPFLGICYGMQLACIEFARNVCELPDAMTSEVDETAGDPVIDFMPDQRNLEMYGGTMRLGTYACTLEDGQSSRAGLRRAGDQRTPPAPLRVQQPLPADLRRARHAVYRPSHDRQDASRRSRSSCRPICTRGSSVPRPIRSLSRGPNRPSPLYRDFIGAALAHGTPGGRRRNGANARGRLKRNPPSFSRATKIATFRER